MSEKELPKYPNYRGTLGSSLPVVGALMASVSAALLAVPLVKEGSHGEELAVLPWNTDQLAICFGVLALILFSFAAICGLYAHAMTVDQVDKETLNEMFTEWSDDAKKTKIAGWRTSGDSYYGKAARAWVSGASSLCITIGLIAYGEVWILLPVLSCLSGLIAFMSRQEGSSGCLTALLFVGVSVVMFLSSVL
ncbi:hypothetical protein ACF1AX_35160 [Streptomyces sp. NPDC014802]|uniref:hypothetical protein n=1 Tax=Streptomyces sp. NPDC014802 TaxID=3364917 RepID=UPI0036FFB82F